MNCCREDFEFGKILPRFTQNFKVPVKYRLDGREYEGIPEEFGPEYRTERIDTNITRTVVSGGTPEGLALRAECTEYADFPVTEWVMYITNESSANSALISDWRLFAEFLIAYYTAQRRYKDALALKTEYAYV